MRKIITSLTLKNLLASRQIDISFKISLGNKGISRSGVKTMAGY
jgi:hypothetical protein